MDHCSVPLTLLCTWFLALLFSIIFPKPKLKISSSSSVGPLESQLHTSLPTAHSNLRRELRILHSAVSYPAWYYYSYIKSSSTLLAVFKFSLYFLGLSARFCRLPNTPVLLRLGICFAFAFPLAAQAKSASRPQLRMQEPTICWQTSLVPACACWDFHMLAISEFLVAGLSLPVCVSFYFILYLIDCWPF